LTAGDKSAVIFAGMKAMRTKASGAEYYGEPGIDGCGYKGYHAEPYYGDILFYDPEILAEVAQGTIESHEIQPYATFSVEDYMFMQGCRRTILGGVAYDRLRGLLYVMEKGVEGIYARKPIVHVFRVTDQAQEPDLVAPTVPQNLQADSVTSEQVNFSWDVSSDNVRLVGYIVHRDSVPVATTVITSYNDDKVNPSATYSYTVVAWDARNNRSAPSAPLVATTLAGPDSRAPIITEVRARDITESSASISWKTDEPATTYIKYGITYSGDETTIEDPTLTTTHQVELTGLTADADYSYHIASADATGNEHEYPGKSFETSPPGGAANSEPVLNGIGSRRVYEGEALQFTVSADDKDRDALTYSASDVPPGASFDAGTQQFSWTPGFDDAGTYRVTFTVSDTTQPDSERVTMFVLDNPLLVLQGSPADQAIHLTWTVNATLPVTVAWEIDYQSQTGTVYLPISGIISPTRAYTLTGLTNYTFYTVTLNAMLESTPFLTDTVRVMPTDIFVYLPLVLR
jgi:chitodextrinase